MIDHIVWTLRPNRHTRLTKDCINWDIDHPASETNAYKSSTVSSNIYNLTMQSAPSTETVLTFYCPVGWGCRIHLLFLCRGVRPPQKNECSGYDTKQSNGEVPVMMELWGMWSTSSLPSLPGPLWPQVVVPNRVLSMGQIELNCILMLNRIT